jgi:hypothetical protein
MSDKILVNEERDGQVIVSEVRPIEVLAKVARAAKESENLHQFAEKTKAIPAKDLHFSLLWDKFNTLKIADSVMNGLLGQILDMDQDGGRNDN